MFLRSVTIMREKFPQTSAYPFSNQAFSTIGTIALSQHITLLVGEKWKGRADRNLSSRPTLPSC